MSDKTIADKMFLKNAKSMLVINGKANPALVAQLPAELIDETPPPSTSSCCRR